MRTFALVLPWKKQLTKRVRWLKNTHPIYICTLAINWPFRNLGRKKILKISLYCLWKKGLVKQGARIPLIGRFVLSSAKQSIAQTTQGYCVQALVKNGEGRPQDFVKFQNTSSSFKSLVQDRCGSAQLQATDVTNTELLSWSPWSRVWRESGKAWEGFLRPLYDPGVQTPGTALLMNDLQFQAGTDHQKVTAEHWGRTVVAGFALGQQRQLW